MLKPANRDGVEEAATLHLVEEINHRVINEYADVICTLSVAAMQASNQDARDKLASAAKQIKAFAQTHRALLPPHDNKLIDLGEYIGLICERMLDASLGQKGVRIALSAGDALVSPRRGWRIGLVIAELIRNSCKHGFSGSAGDIFIDVAQSRGEVFCTVRDDGCATDVGNGRGRRLIELIVAELGGSIEWDFTPDGSTATLRVPAAELIAH